MPPETPTRRTFLAILASALAWLCPPARTQSTTRAAGAGRRPRPDDFSLPPELPDFAALSLVLGRITDRAVTAVFRAHDNFYACQELDGITYLMVPQPSFAGDDRIRDLANYGYKQGTFIGNSGYVRVTVSKDQTVTEYVRTLLGNPVADRHVMQAK